MPPNQIFTPFLFINGFPSHEIRQILLNIFANKKIGLLKKKYLIGPEKFNKMFLFIFFLYKRLLKAIFLNLCLNTKKKNS